MVTQTVTLQPMEVYSETEIHPKALEDPMLEQVDSQRRLWLLGKPVLEQAPGRTCGTTEREAHTRAGFLTCGDCDPARNRLWISSQRAAACGENSSWKGS
ncbi:hypothetical protein DUI87_10327 [Hirundo rustica rustica]|uniref:Uncharacterized protein n=1 Tax=Hirundo rustica rustica TaxID=333673 RepID=A0A3M0KHV5_HIRRU|nr:hypothetical protein DUI87_10327 [Hirundo rustica rustica]